MLSTIKVVAEDVNPRIGSLSELISHIGSVGDRDTEARKDR